MCSPVDSGGEVGFVQVSGGNDSFIDVFLGSEQLFEFSSGEVSELVETDSGGVVLGVVLIDLFLVLSEGLDSEAEFFFGAVVSAVFGNILEIFLFISRDGSEELSILGGGEG